MKRQKNHFEFYITPPKGELYKILKHNNPTKESSWIMKNNETTKGESL